MDKVLFVLDMQEIYVGRGRNKEKYRYDSVKLVNEINKRIAEYAPDEVFYFRSIGKGIGAVMSGMPKEGTHEAKLVAEMKIVGKNIYDKTKPDAFSVEGVGDFIRARNVKEIEIIGVDGGTSVGATAVAAIDNYDLRVIYNDSCIGTMNTAKAVKYREKMRKNRITFVST